MKGEKTLSDLLDSTEAAPKKCAYQTCQNTIPAAHQFPYCDVCRVLMTRNAIVLLQDPFSPIPLPRPDTDRVKTELLTSLTGEEILRFVNRIEETYLSLKGYIKLHKIGETTPRVKQSLSEEVEEIRAGQEQRSLQIKIRNKKEKKVKTNREKLQKLLGSDNAQTKKILGQLDLSDL